MEPRIVLTGDIIISEFMAVNNSTLTDEDNSSSDWIELFNKSTEPVNIGGWHLTDDAEDLTKWQFPDVTMGPDEFLVVFASDKDRRDPDRELHTNFKLTSAGEYLGLVQSDGTTSHEFGTIGGEIFPEQLPDVSYGVEQTTFDYSFVADGAEVGVLIPTSAGDDLPAATWTAAGFDDGSWSTHNLGVGFDGGGELLGELSENGNLAADMQGITSSAYVRAEFNIDGPVPEMDALTMNVNYDDGYVAYLNGVEVASSNAPASRNWSSQATQSHGGELMSIDFDGFSDNDVRDLFTINGGSQFAGDRLQVTRSAASQTGAMWLTEPLVFSSDYSFSTAFAMDVHSPAGLPFLEAPDADGNGGQGMTFVLQAGGPFRLGGARGELGLDNAGMAFVAVEFDTFASNAAGQSFDDHNSAPTHIGIDTSADGSVASVGVPRFNGDAQGVNPRYVWVDYDGFTDTMDVYFSETRTKPAAATLSSTVDLESLFGGVPSLWAGFTGATSFNQNAHDVLDWEITTFSNELGLTTETIDLSDRIGLLQTGPNVLAIHGLNLNAQDGDFLVDATLAGALSNVTLLDSPTYFTIPSPGEPNGSGGERPASKVEFSGSGRTFIHSLTVELAAADPNAVIRYTTDGSLPTELSDEYTGPLTVTETTRFRARAFEEGLSPGPVQTQSYIQLAPDLASFEGGVFASNLPLVVLDSFGNGAADSSLANHTVNFHGATALVFDIGANGIASLAREPDFVGQLGMRRRGQSSQAWPKGQYALEFWDESIDYTGAISGKDGPDDNVRLLDLPSESDWVLQGPYSDKSQLNNFLAFNLYRSLGLEAPRVRLVEAFVNADGGPVDFATDYRGTYILMEKIKIDNNRVDIPDPISDPLPDQDPTTVGGYIFKRDKGGSPEVNFNTSGHGGPALDLQFHEPDTPNLAQKTWLAGYVNKAEEVLYSNAFADPEIGYAKYFDVDSFIDHWLITELSKEIDGFRLSEYFFINREGKIEKGPAWDYNLSFSNANYHDGGQWDAWYYNGLSGPQYQWYPRLLDDPNFEIKLRDRWFELRETTFSWQHLEGMIDEAVAALTNGSPSYDTPAPGEPSNPISRNFDRWGTIDTYLWPNCFFGIEDPATPLTDGDGSCGDSPLPPEMSANGQPNSYDDYVFIMKDFVRNRLEWIDNEFGRPPQFDPPGGIVPAGTQVTLTTDQPETIYYTTDGTDPREQPDNAIEYTDPIPIDQNIIVIARSYDAPTDQWSPRSSQTYFVDVPPLVVTELNYNPAAATPAEIAALYGNVAADADNDDFEFMEIMNVGSDPFDLTGVTIVDGVDFTFEAGELAAGERGVIVRNRAAFEFRYGADINILGSWANAENPAASDKLNNDGEHIRIQGPLGEPTMDFTYNDAWYPLTDGRGFSLVIADPHADPGTWGAAASWRPSDLLNGSPGSGDAGIAPLPGSVIVNEVVANSSTGNDAIELRNTTGSPVDIGNFFLTDDPQNLEKFVVPAGTLVPANGYTVIDTTDIGNFALADTGGRIVIQAANAAGEYLGFQTDRRFDAAFPDTSEGVYTNSLGNVDFVSLTSLTLGSDNAGPTIGPVVINEIMYNPPFGKPEWFELKNISASTVNLGADLWVVVEGIDYAFPSDATLEAGGFAVLVQGVDNGDVQATVAAFRADNNVPANVSIYVYEPTAHGSLDNAGEDIAIGRRLDVGLPAVRFELIEYDDSEPWPPEADGTGSSLVRIAATSYGNEPGNWAVGGLGGSPGADTRGDLDVDGTFDIDDINLLVQGIRNDATDSAFDIDGNGVVDTDDITEWLSVAGKANIGAPYVPGDADLDGIVDARDLNKVGVNWQQNVTGWSQADFHADGIVNANDLNAVGLNWLHGIAAAASAGRVPRAPLAAQIDAAHAVPADAVIPVKITVPKTPPLRIHAGTSQVWAPSSARDDTWWSAPYRTWTDTHRYVSGQQGDNDEKNVFTELADEILAAWQRTN